MVSTIEGEIDLVLRRIFQVTLMPSSSKNLMYLGNLAAQLLIEKRALLFTSKLIERVLVARFEFCSTSETPFMYVVACYKRALEEQYRFQEESNNVKSMKNTKNTKLKTEMFQLFTNAKELTLQYAGCMLLRTNMFFQFDQKKPLVDLVFNTVNSVFHNAFIFSKFLDDMFTMLDGKEANKLLDAIFEGLRDLMCTFSFSDQFQKPLDELVILVSSCPLAAKALVHHSTWHPKGNHVNGRHLEYSTILGAFFHISAIPDSDGASTCDQVSRDTIQTTMHQLYNGLHKVLLALLDNPQTREHVLELLADIVEKNASRTHTGVDFLKNTSTGMFVNLSVVMLRLCKTSFSKSDRIDLTYVLMNRRVDFTNLTAIHATSEERAHWVDKSRCAQLAGKEVFAPQDLEYEQDKLCGLQSKDYSLDCECFFLAARVLHLGLIQALSELQNLEQALEIRKDDLKYLKIISEIEPMRYGLKETISEAEATICKMVQDKYCYEAQLKDTELLQQGLAYYDLMLQRLVSPFGGFRDSLPTICPMQFASIPEHFIEDAMDFLIFVLGVPNAMDGIVLNSFMSFIVMFIWNPEYVKNPYLRAKMVKVLSAWMLLEINNPSSANSVFGEYHLARHLLVPNLLKLYVDTECTGSDKYLIRYEICKLLRYLWRMHVHRDRWKGFALREERGFYLKFLNLLINDITFTLDTSFQYIRSLKEIEVLQTLKEIELLQTEEGEWEQMQQVKQNARAYMKFAKKYLRMLRYTTFEITSSLLLPEMAGKVASMLNYFLLQLVCKSAGLNIKEPRECGFDLQALLVLVAQVYVNIARGDEKGIFAKAISTDNMSYRDGLISKAILLLGNFYIDKLGDLERKVAIAATEALAEEAMLGEVPDEFLDPIQCTLMIDPVILPSSKASVDRTTIQRHLLSYQTDPFNRSFLTSGMLIPDIQLKARIDEFLSSRRSI